MKRLALRGQVIISALVLLYVAVLVLDISPYVRGPDEWRWATWPVAQWERVWPLVIALLLIPLGVRWLDRRARQSPQPQRVFALGVALLIAIAPMVQLLALRIERANPIAVLFDRAVDVAANGYFTVGNQITSVPEFLRQYPALMPTFPIHPQVHPPGVPLIYWFTGSLLESLPALARPISLYFRQLECNNIDLMLLSDARLASALAGMLLPVLANLVTIWCVFKLTQARFGARAGWYAAALWVIVPSTVLFPGSWSLVYPCLACLTWLAVDAGLKRRGVGWFLVAGLLLSIGTFLELGTATLGLFFVLYIGLRYGLDRRNPLRDGRFLASALIATLIGVFSIWGGYQWLYGVGLPQMVQAMYPIHTGYEFDRLVWLINHPYEFAVFVGLPVAAVLIVATIRAAKVARTGRADPLTLAVSLGLIVLTLVDPARDETARTWLLFMPFAVVAIAPVIVTDQARSTHFGWLWTSLAVQLVAMVAVLNVMQVGLYGLPPRSTVAAVPPTAMQTQADFKGMAQLAGYTIEQAADRLIVEWYWRGTGPVDRPYTVFNHVLNDQRQLVGQRDERPQGGQPLMTCWQPGEIYRDQHIIDLPPGLPAGAYTLEVGLYDAQTGDRVPLTAADGSQTDRVELGPIDLK
ncbi:MAG TPA: hypothetical protein VFF59_12820 [Anaerolineae bacterium]|nr:hypothetical protein [Anaerolineae bacterium]